MRNTVPLLTAALALAPLAATAEPAAATAGIQLERTVGTDLAEGACGTAKNLVVPARTAVNFCYRLTNRSTTTLRYQTLRSTHYGELLRYADIELAPGQTWQLNDVRLMTQDLIDSATWTADDALAGYTFTKNPAGLAWDDISATGTLWVNDASFATIPFPFTFFGEAESGLDVVDGMLGFGRGDLSAPYANTDIPNGASGLRKTVMPYWDNWNTLDGKLYWQIQGTSPNRRLVVQWQDRQIIAAPQGMTYQAVLFEATGEIAFLYRQLDDGVTDPSNAAYYNSFGRSATIGLNFDGTRASRYSFETAAPDRVVENGDALLFTPTPFARHVADDAVAVTVVGPQVEVDATPIAVETAAGGSASRDFVIGNSGTSNLHWELDPALAAASHLPPASPPWPARTSPAPAHQGALPGVGAPLPAASEAAAANPRGEPQVPAWAYTASQGGFSLARFDVAAPGVLTTIDASYPAGEPDFDFTGLEFVGTDFSRLYGLAYSTGALYSLDATTGEARYVGTAEANAGEARQDLAWDPVSGDLYALATRSGQPAQLSLYTIDPATGASTQVASLKGMGTSIVNAIGINAMGQMYGIDITQDRLVAIDKLTGDTRVVGPLGFNANMDQALEYDDATDTMYWIGGVAPTPPQPGPTQYRVFTVDTETGAATPIGDFGPSPISLGTSGFAIAHANPCMLPSQVPWLTLSETRGVVGPTDVDTVRLGFDAGDLAPGDYSALLCLASDDPLKPRVRVPVTMTVAAPDDAIFRDGFDGAAPPRRSP